MQHYPVNFLKRTIHFSTFLPLLFIITSCIPGLGDVDWDSVDWASAAEEVVKGVTAVVAIEQDCIYNSTLQTYDCPNYDDRIDSASVGDTTYAPSSQGATGPSGTNGVSGTSGTSNSNTPANPRSNSTSSGTSSQSIPHQISKTHESGVTDVTIFSREEREKLISQIKSPALRNILKEPQCTNGSIAQYQLTLPEYPVDALQETRQLIFSSEGNFPAMKAQINSLGMNDKEGFDTVVILYNYYLDTLRFAQEFINGFYSYDPNELFTSLENGSYVFDDIDNNVIQGTSFLYVASLHLIPYFGMLKACYEEIL